MILRDWICSVCDTTFEAWDDEPVICPQCGADDSLLSQTWTKPPGTRSIKTSNADAIVGDLMSAHGLTDYNQNPSTSHAYSPPKNTSVQHMEAPAKLQVDLRNGKQTVIDRGISKMFPGGTPTPFGNVQRAPEAYNALSEAPKLPPVKSQTLFLKEDGNWYDHRGRRR